MHETSANTGLSESGLCPHCKGKHALPCPHVRAVEYYPDGQIKRVEYVIAQIPPSMTFDARYPNNRPKDDGRRPALPTSGSGVIRPKF